jgi:hypothetical protein
MSGSMTAPLAEAKLAPSGNPKVNNPATAGYNDRLRLAIHARAESLLQNYGFVQFAPGRWSLEGHEVDLPPAANMTYQNFDAFTEPAGAIADMVSHQRAQAQNPKPATPVKLQPLGSGGPGDCAHPGDPEDETEGGCR